jgi:hypothetical protein
VSARKQPYVLKHDIVLETRDAEGNEHEEVLKPAGTTVIVRRPKAKDLMVFDQYPDKPMNGVRALLRRVVKLDEAEIDNLDGEDFDALGELVAPGSTSGPTTGATA